MHKTAHFSPEKTNFYTPSATFFTTYTAKSNLNPAKRAPANLMDKGKIFYFFLHYRGG